MLSLLPATAAVEFGPMPHCLERAVHEVTVPGGTQTLGNLSGGSSSDDDIDREPEPTPEDARAARDRLMAIFQRA